MIKHRTRIFIDDQLHHRLILGLNNQADGKKVDLDQFIHITLEEACRKLHRQAPASPSLIAPAPYQTIDPDKLEFPKDLAPSVGLQSTQISFMKRQGCKFYGRKTTLRWVREFIAANLH